MRLTLKTAAALALLSFASLALADPSARVARIAGTSGQVIVHGIDTDDVDSGLLNWPLSTGNRISTLRGAGAEVRLGSSAVRLDGDSELEITELDDDSFALRLLYGGASVRIRNADALAGFVLDTPQARVRLEQPGWVRVEADRPPGTSVVSVLEGAAVVDGRGASLTVRAGKRAELNDEQVLTGPLQRSAMDNWPEAAVVQAAAPALRYITEDITGYEELDRYGSWSDSAEYGPLWLPRGLPSGWAPYSDGRWTWVAPWGWTWVDNAPWGYAPSHYGRWVMVGQRWSWAPGRGRERPVWAPALVGWVGSHGAGQHSAQGPAVGWFPLSPRERYVPGYRASPDYERRINTDGRWNASAAQRQRRDGLSLLPQEQFSQRRQVPVARPAAAQHTAPLAPLSTAPQPQPQPGWARPDTRPQDRFDTRRPDWNRPRPLLGTEAPPRTPNQPPQPPQPAQPQQPAQPPQPPQQGMPDFNRERERYREREREREQQRGEGLQQRERGRRDGRIESGTMPALPQVTMPRAQAVAAPAPSAPSAAPAPSPPPPRPVRQPESAPRAPAPDATPGARGRGTGAERHGQRGNNDEAERAR